MCSWTFNAVLVLSFTALAAFSQSLSGVVDVHAHAYPDSTDRSIDAVALATLARNQGFRGIVLEYHLGQSPGVAYLAGKYAPGLHVFGGVVMGHAVGGVNPAAVRQMVRQKNGAGKFVWMPTLDSENKIRHSGQTRPFVSVARNGQLLPEVLQVIDLCAKHNLVMANGHNSPAEALLLIREATRRGVKSVMATHPIVPPINMTVEQMKEAAGLGAYVEFIYYSVGRPDAPVTFKQYADAIRAIGPERCILSSCGGQGWIPVLHPQALELLFKGLREQGINQQDIETMSKTNPARLVGLE